MAGQTLIHHFRKVKYQVRLLHESKRESGAANACRGTSQSRIAANRTKAAFWHGTLHKKTAALGFAAVFRFKGVVIRRPDSRTTRLCLWPRLCRSRHHPGISAQKHRPRSFALRHCPQAQERRHRPAQRRFRRPDPRRHPPHHAGGSRGERTTR